jgi:hypothetical protein
MASYESLPAAAEDGLLLETPKPKTNSLKGLVACAAIASFVLGMLAATAVTQHAIATQTNLNAVGSVINAATSRPAGEESCGGQWGFALAFGRKDAKNQCPPGESAPPPLSLSLSLPLSLCLLIPNRDTLFWCAGSQCDKTTNTCVSNSYFEALDDPTNQVSAAGYAARYAAERRR